MIGNKAQLRFWLIVFVFLAAALWFFKPMLLPFTAGMVIAYFLDPLVERLTRRHIPRWLSSMLVLGTFVLLIVLLLLLIVPIFRDQLAALLNALPAYIEKARSTYMPWVQNWLARFSPDTMEQLKGSAGDYAANAAGFVGETAKKIVTESIALIDVVALSIITPIVAFYMLRDWPQLTAALDRQIPRRFYKNVRQELQEIDQTLAGFIRGQALVCVALGIYYSLGLTLTGLKYGFSIGILAGVLSFIPYVGTAFAWVASLILASVQFDSSGHIGIVFGVLYLGHLLEAYVLGPKLIGHRVGLHPVWILFALIAGAKLMGFLGLLVAVPVAAVMGVLVRFGLRQYRSSHFYKDHI